MHVKLELMITILLLAKFVLHTVLHVLLHHLVSPVFHQLEKVVLVIVKLNIMKKTQLIVDLVVINVIHV